MVRISFFCPDEITEKVDSLAKSHGLTRSGALNWALSAYFEQKEQLQTLPELIAQTQELVKHVQTIQKRR